MPLDLVPPLLLALCVGLVASAYELRASLQPPVCPRCVHCRHEALAKKEREGRERQMTMTSMWGLDDRDDDPKRPRR